MRGKSDKKGGKALLGNIYGICTRFEQYTRLSNHGKRYKLQSTIRYILPTNKRLLVCNRVIANPDEWVKVKHSPTTNRAKYGNLLQCGNGWICPVCAGRIAETRKKELHIAVVAALQMNLKPVMITFTLRHGFKDALKPLLTDLLKAYRAMTSHRPYQKLKKDFGFAGYIRALELTYLTGWHPHLHVMMFVPANLHSDPDFAFNLEQSLYEVWSGELARTGRDAVRGVGVNVKTGDSYVAEYIAKYGKMPAKGRWSIEQEMTGAIAKKSRGADGDGTTPFGIAMDYLFGGDEEDAELFREYEAATKGRSILQWSRGLAELLGIDLVDDVAALDMSAPDFVDVLLFNLEMWRAIVKTGNRAAVLDATEASKGNGKAVEIVALLEAIKARVKQDDINPMEEYQG